MKLLAVDSNPVTVKTYTVEREGDTYFYIDYINDQGKIVDSILRTTEGYEVDVPALFEEIQEFVDQEDTK